MISRRQTREYLLQTLYARVHLSPFDRDIFYGAYFLGDHSLSLDMVYLDGMEGFILAHEGDLIGLISPIAPRFDLETIPMMHILILMIALTEMLYWTGEAIPPSVSINEAIEMTKKFSDDAGKTFINGALATFLKQKDTLKLQVRDGKFRIFATK
jgi:transcription antitermination protein NusB